MTPPAAQAVVTADHSTVRAKDWEVLDPRVHLAGLELMHRHRHAGQVAMHVLTRFTRRGHALFPQGEVVPVGRVPGLGQGQPVRSTT
jgi:hypothetical protein